MKKGMQMVQGLNDEASKVSQESTTKNTNMNSEEKKKCTHWSGVQMQGFQSHIHIQLCQNVNVTEEPEHDEVTNKEIDPTQPEEEHELKHPLKHNTDQIMSLDRGSTFNSMNNEESPINVMDAVQPITPRTNVGQHEMKKCGKTPELTKEMRNH